MANWEYKVISSGKHGMATMAALEQHLNELGQQQWEIINWHTAPDNPLLFTGLARRPILRDWKPDEMPAAQEAARVERVTEESKEREAWRQTLKEELEFLTDEEEDTSDPEEDREDLLDLLRAQMKRSQRGAGHIGSVSFLARKLEQDENDLLGALAEVGLPLEEDPQAATPSIQHEGEYFWLNKNSRGEVWLNSGPKAPAAKPAPRAEKQRSAGRQQPPAEVKPEVEGTFAPEPEGVAGAEPGEFTEAAPSQPAPAREPRREQRQPQPPQQQRESAPAAPLPEGEPLLVKIRPMMRRNRRGRGWSGSTSYLSRALRHPEAELMEAFAKIGLTLTEDPQAKPIFVELSNFLYWLNRGQGGQIWINAREKRPGETAASGADDAEEAGPGETSAEPAPAAPATELPAAEAPVATVAPAPAEPAPAAEPAATPEPVAAEADSAEPVAEAEPADAEEPAAPADDNSVFARIRPHFTKNKRGTSYSAAPGAVAEALALSQADLVESLVKAGLEVPEAEDSKPVFAEHAGEIFWFNRNAKDELWLNAKAKPARRPSRSGSRTRKSAE